MAVEVEVEVEVEAEVEVEVEVAGGDTARVAVPREVVAECDRLAALWRITAPA